MSQIKMRQGCLTSPNKDTRNCSEFSTSPAAVIVHDPVRAGAFTPMESAGDPASLEREFLYRELPNRRTYAEQHRILVARLRRHVPRVIYLHELVSHHEFYRFTSGNPNQVFTRDSVITLPWVPNGYFKARMRPPQRRSESEIMGTALEALGLQEILRVPEGMFLEGGDVIPFNREGRRTLLVGCGRRTSFETLEFLQQELIPSFTDEVIGIELTSWRMNLDGGLMPVTADLVVADRENIVRARLYSAHGCHEINLWDLFEDLGMHIIDTTPEESLYMQSCNYVCLGDRKVIGYDLCKRVRDSLRAHGVETHLIPGTELVKGRGGPRCMTRPIYDASVGGPDGGA